MRKNYSAEAISNINDRKVKAKAIVFHRENLCLDHNNFKKPFLWLVRKLVGDPYLELVAIPALLPPKGKMDKDWQQQIEKDLQEAQARMMICRGSSSASSVSCFLPQPKQHDKAGKS